jgi:hypothetical protein
MSPEALFLLALFVLLPLIERLLRSMRQQNAGPPDVAADVPRPASPRATPPPPPASQRRPTLDARASRTAAVPPLPASTAARRSPRRVAVPDDRRAVHRGTIVEDLRKPLTLRRAVLLMTILGPCRSVVPHDWGERQDTK